MSEDRRVNVRNIETIESDDTEDDRGQMNSNVLLRMHKDQIIITILKWFVSMMGNIKIKNLLLESYLLNCNYLKRDLQHACLCWSRQLQKSS